MRKQKECPGCAMDVDADAEVCPICNYEFPAQPKSIKIVVWILLILMLIWIFF